MATPAADELSLQDLYKVLRRRREELLLTWIVVFACVAIYTAFMKPLYRATVTFKLQVSDDNNRTIQVGPYNVMGSNNGPNIQEALTPDIVRMYLLHAGRITPNMPDAQSNAILGELFQRVSIQTNDKQPDQAYLSVTGSKGIGLGDEANGIAQILVNVVTNQANAKTRQAKDFIDSQLREVEVRLRDSEDQLRRYQEKFGPSSAGGFLLNRLMELKTRKTELSQKYTSSYPELREINGEIQTIESQMQKLPTQEIDIARVTRDLRNNEDLYNMLVKKAEDVRIMESAGVDPLSIADLAIDPSRPERPNKPFNLMAGAVLGFLIGLAVVWVRHQLDTSLITTQEVEEMLQLPVLAMVPHIERRKVAPEKAVGPTTRKEDHLGRLRSCLAVNYPANSGFVEVYHILRTNLPQNEGNDQGRLILFTSAVVGEGKSLTAANFAIVAAQAGVPTLLVETDLRSPMLDRLFGVPRDPGLLNYFYTSPRWENYLKGWSQIRESSPSMAEAINTGGMANLHILTAGKVSTNPVALLGSDRFVHLLEDMRKRFPLIVIDSPPVMLFADCTIMAPHVDGIILVYRFGRTGREVLSRSRNQLLSSKGKILGVVVNDMLRGAAVGDENYYAQYDYYSNPNRTYK